MYTDPGVAAGVYAIRNLTNDKRYVGSSFNLRERWRKHLGMLRRGAHHSKTFQKAWNKYGEDAFVFEVLEIVVNATREMLFARERHWFRMLRPEYVGKLDPTLGWSHTPEARARMRASHLGKPLSPEHRAVLAARHQLPEVRERNRAFHTGLKDSAETRKRKSLAAKGRKRTTEHQAKLNAAQRGRPKSEETRRKIAETLRGHRHTAEARARIAAAGRRPCSEETKRKIAEARRGHPVSAETRAKISQKSRQRRGPRGANSRSDSRVSSPQVKNLSLWEP